MATRLHHHAARIVFAAILLATAARPARADAPSKVSAAAPAPGLVGEAERWLLAAAAGPTVASEPTMRAPPTAERAVSEEEGRSGVEGKAPVDLIPRGSVVVRDWHGSRHLFGDQALVVDELRPTASTRMLVGRLVTGSRLRVFVQAGVGEWRIDRVMFPGTLSYSELAAQVGTGFELRLSSRLRVATEGQYAMLDKDLHTDGVAPSIFAFVVAIDGRF